MQIVYTDIGYTFYECIYTIVYIGGMIYVSSGRQQENREVFG